MSARGAPVNARPYGQVIMGAPVAFRRNSSAIDIVALGSDYGIYHRQWTGSSWTSWARIGTNTFRSQPVGVVRRSDRLHVLGVDRNTGELMKTYYNGSRWASWGSVGGAIVGTPAVVSIDEDHLDIFAITPDKQLAMLSWSTASSWGSWESLGGSLRGAPTAVEHFPNRIDVLAKDGGQTLMHKVYYPLTGSFRSTSWRRISSQPVIGSPQLVGDFDGRLRIVATGDDRQLYSGVMGINSSSVTLSSLGGPVRGAPVAFRLDDTIHVLARSTSDRLVRKFMSDTLEPTWSSSFLDMGVNVSW